jgi:hypothetical protein
VAFFKKKVTPEEFGQAITHLVKGPLSSDALRSLGTRFEDFDASSGWAVFLERKGVSRSVQSLYCVLFIHCAIQAACTQFDEATRHVIVHGATIDSFASTPDGYDFQEIYEELEAIYRGRLKFDQRLEPLSNSDFQFPYLPNPNAGVLTAKYLIESFIVPNMVNSKAFIDDFKGYSGTVCVAIGVVQRALDQLFKSVSLSSPSISQVSSTIHAEKGRALQNRVSLKSNAAARWNALVRYDDEIRAAAERLRPFGDMWVSKLGQDFFALNEDRKYLPNIVARLIAEAKLAQEEEQSKREREQEERLMHAFRVLADGNLCTEESLNILREALAHGFKLGIEKDKTITVTKPGGGYTTYLRSNNDIQKFSGFENFR